MPRWKIWTIIILSIIGLFLALPNVLPQHTVQSFKEQSQVITPHGKETAIAWLPRFLINLLPTQTVNLGLDLQGGAQLTLQVEVAKAIEDYYQGMQDSVRREFRAAQIGYRDLKTDASGLRLTLRDAQQSDAARKLLRKMDNQLDVNINTDGKLQAALLPDGLQKRKNSALEQSVEIVRRRIDETGTKEPVIVRQGDDRIIVQLPGVGDPEHIKSLLGKTAKLTFNLVDMSIDPVAGIVPVDSMKLPMQDHPELALVVKKQAAVTGDNLTSASASFSQDGKPSVAFEFNNLGARRFAEITKDNVGKPFAIVLDNKIISAPNIREPITGGRGEISGNFTTEQANDLSLLLRAGALPAPLKVIEERTVGPTLGADSIASGRKASIIGLVAVCILAIVSYGTFGLMASFALMCNMVFIFAIMSLLQSTLTLPGIAGIVLTIGMAVDANVLIFERIREEYLAGRSPLSAIDAGYARGMSAVIDTNLTALISAIVLMSFGVGPVRGFAVTLIVGVITSLFSAVWLTRLIMMAWYHFARPNGLPFQSTGATDV